MFELKYLEISLNKSNFCIKAKLKYLKSWNIESGIHFSISLTVVPQIVCKYGPQKTCKAILLNKRPNGHGHFDKKRLETQNLAPFCL